MPELKLPDDQQKRGGIGRSIRESVFDHLSLIAALRQSPLAAEMIGRLRDQRVKIKILDRRSGGHVHLPGSRLTRKKPDWVPREEVLAVLTDDAPTSIANSLFILKQKYQSIRTPNFDSKQLRIEDRLWFETVKAADATAFAMLSMLQMELQQNRSLQPFLADPKMGGFRCSEEMWLEMKTRHASVTYLFGPHALPDMSQSDPLAVILPRDGKPHWGACLSAMRRRLLTGGPEATVDENPWLAATAVDLAKAARKDWGGHWRPGHMRVRESDLQRVTRWGGRDTHDARENRNPFENLSDRPNPRSDSPKILDRVRAEIEGLRNPGNRYSP